MIHTMGICQKMPTVNSIRLAKTWNRARLRFLTKFTCSGHLVDMILLHCEIFVSSKFFAPDARDSKYLAQIFTKLCTPAAIPVFSHAGLVDFLKFWNCQLACHFVMLPSKTLLDIVSQPFKRSQLGLFHGKMKQYGNNVPFSKHKTRRTWLPNVQQKRLPSEILNKDVRVKVTTRAMRSIKKVRPMYFMFVFSSSRIYVARWTWQIRREYPIWAPWLARYADTTDAEGSSKKAAWWIFRY